MATSDDVGARVVCGGLHPDHATSARFVTRHKEPLTGLLVASLVACAREGLVRVDVTAGDGTKVKANASMAADATAEQLGLDIAELERLLEAEVQAWIEQARAAGAAGDTLSGGDDGPPPGAGPGGRKRAAGKLARRRAAQAKLAADQQARQEQAEAERAERIAELAAEKDRLAGRAAQELARGQAKADRYAQRAAARTAGSATWPRGRRPAPAEQQRDVRAAAAAAARAAARLEEAIAAPAVPPAPARPPARPPRANATDLASRVMPLKKGGFDQLYNLQALAGRGPVIAAIATHDSTAGTYALHPLLAAGAADLAAAGISDPIGKALFDAGYASGASFTAPCDARLYIAVTRESVQAGKLDGGQVPLPAQLGWRAMAAKLATPEGQVLYKQRKAIIEPVFAQLSARFGRTLHYRGDLVTTEIHLWAAVRNTLKAIGAPARREQCERQAAAPQPAPAAA